MTVQLDEFKTQQRATWDAGDYATLSERIADVGEIEWVEGDAEELPFEDASFDRVLSTFGHMFAPRHQPVADEMIRVCQRGGAIVTATWTAEGVFGAISAASAPFMPPPPGVRLAARPLGKRGVHPSDVRLSRDGVRARAPRQLDRRRLG
jgi:SAM-dependent methyltransferase